MTIFIRPNLLLTLAFTLCALTVSSRAGDWPQFRYDAGRTAASPNELPAQLQLRWTRTLPAPRPAFPGEVRLGYDASYEPVVLGHTMYVPSMVNDSVTALDTETGAERWRFITDGPVRFAPVAWNGKVYFVSDDGYLYCVNDDGSLRWKFRGLPEGRRDRKVLGNGRLVSLWPARGGPVFADGVVFFAAGLWPTEGVFVHAVDAETGKPVWSNTTCDRIKESNFDHGVGGEAGLAPQGYIAIDGDRLIVPCGAQLPAFLDLKTGNLQKYTTGWGGRLGLPKGCWFVAAAGKYLSHGGDLFDITRPSEEKLQNVKPGDRDFKTMLYPGGWMRLDIERSNQRELDRFRQPVLTPDVMYESDGRIVARDLTSYEVKQWTKENIPAHRVKDEVPDNLGGVLRQLWELPSKLDVHIKAGARLYTGGPGAIEAIDVTPGKSPAVVWHADIEGTPQRMLAADDKLFVVSVEGRIFAFGAPATTEVPRHVATETPPPAADDWTKRAADVIAATGVHDGYALVLGIDTGRLAEELARQSSLQVIVLDESADKIAALRQRLYPAGLYGTRISAHVGNPVSYPFPPFLANLVVSETPGKLAQAGQRALMDAVFHTLRPYGGVACGWDLPVEQGRVEEIAKDNAYPGAQVRKAGDFLLLSRTGPLPGAADWSHADANAACTGASEDDFIRSPMSLLWFDAAQRWHKFPGQNQVRVVEGRVVLLENGRLRVSDVFTGRMMWQEDLSKEPIDRDRIHYDLHRQWGPAPTLSPSTEFVVVPDAIYVSTGKTCLIYDPVAGKPSGAITLPDDLASPWENLRISDEYIVGTSGRTVLCINRHTGKLQWRSDAARDQLRLVVGAGKVFCAELADARRGEDDTRDGNIFALNLATGERVWQIPGGAMLRYSPLLDVVVTPTGCYRGLDGQPVPQQSDEFKKRLVITGNGLPKTGLPGYVAGRRLLTGNEENLTVYDLPTGQPSLDPLKWFRRGCTGTRASVHLLTTRFLGNSAWVDLESRKITPLLGIRPGCSVNNNLYPADGVLNIPNLTLGCTCNYAPVSMACVPASVINPRAAE